MEIKFRFFISWERSHICCNRETFGAIKSIFIKVIRIFLKYSMLLYCDKRVIFEWKKIF